MEENVRKALSQIANHAYGSLSKGDVIQCNIFVSSYNIVAIECEIDSRLLLYLDDDTLTWRLNTLSCASYYRELAK